MRKRGLTIALLVAAAFAVTCAGIVIYARRHASGIASAANPPQLVELAPADSTVLFYADLAALRSSSLVMQLAALAPPVTEDREYAEFVRATGFDYQRDLDRVVLAIQSEAQSAGTNSVTTTIADGRFDQNKIAAYALHNGKLEKQNGGDVYVITTKATAKSASKTLAIRFLSSTRVMLRSGLTRELTESLPAATPRGNFPSGETTRFAPEMQERIARVSGAPVFAVAKLNAAMKKTNLPLDGLRSDQLENLARSVRWLSLAARPESNPDGGRVNVALEGECDSAESARQLAGTLDGLRVMGGMALADPKTRRKMDPATLPLVEALLRGAEVSSEDKGSAHRVRLTLVISQKALGAAAATK